MEEKKTNHQDKVEYWQKYWDKLQSATDDSEEKLDGKIFTVSTGGIGLLLGTMGLGHEVLHKGWKFAVVSLIAFAFALGINLFYYRKQKKQHERHFDEIEKFIENPQDNDGHLRKMIKKDNKITDIFSRLAVDFIIIGIISFGVYITLNVIK
ncbi:MAG: hypothetical protein IKI28_08930 [Bacteroidales bacterium]|nr:hypothetical protein [Bacteroidales bacterium]